MNKLMITVAILMFFSFDANSQVKTCTNANTKALDKLSAGKPLNSWNELYQTYKLYAQCDDGLYAEFFSSSTVNLLTANWNQIDTLNSLATKDKKFHKFVIRHVDATADENDLKKAASLAKNKCPAKSSKLCQEIATAAKAASAELNP